MPSQKSIPISELITTANSELLRLDFKRSALQIYCAEFRKFSDYYSNEKIQDYTATTGRNISIHLWRKYCKSTTPANKVAICHAQSDPPFRRHLPVRIRT